MAMKLSEKCFSFAKTVFFDIISSKFRAGSLKRSLDLSYVIFEKIAYNFEIFSSNYINMYCEIVEKEIRLANITSKDNVLVIGAGSLPATSVLIAQKSGASVVSIDVDKAAINKANVLIKRLDLSDKLKLVHADGRYYDFEKFDVIFVLYAIKQLDEIFEKISKKIKTDTRVIYRSVFDKETNTIKSRIDLSKFLEVKNIVKSENISPAASALLLKKDT
ncbi:MAG: class I SAM-dependent methyltransferase [Thermoplasmatales archaeon]|nr:class I SAM-dependent methyltransferase [Thermoplasmatales archaeon]